MSKNTEAGMPYRKKMIEVSLPLEAINVASAREKSIRHGHPSTLHLWWARRPLAACRAVLFASLVDDPSSDPMYAGDEDIEASKRAELFNLIDELVQWDNSNNPRVINKARAEIARCIASRKIETGELKKEKKVAGNATAQAIKSMLASADAVNEFLAAFAPPVLDPFCGGGSIPLEAQRLGLRAYASDLNPVPVLINKALIEIPATFAGKPPVNPDWHKKLAEEKAAVVWNGAKGLAEDLRYYAKWMRSEAEKKIGHFYRQLKLDKAMAKARPDLQEHVGKEFTVIAWLWARTVVSPNPACNGVHVPLVRSFWLSTKKGNEAWINPVIDKRSNHYSFEVCVGPPPNDVDPSQGTVKRTGATCLLSGMPISFDHIREEGKAGRMKTRLLAIVLEGNKGRHFVSPSVDQEILASQAEPGDVPETPIPEQALGFRVQLYGMTRHRDLFSQRQLMAITSFSDLISKAHAKICADATASTGDCADTYADAVTTYLTFAIDKMAEGSTTLCTWSPLPTKLHVVSTFGRQALPMIWDYAEANVFAPSSGNFERMAGLVAKVIEAQAHVPVISGIAVQLDATRALPSVVDPVICTDPPYYDNIGYADLSDFFYIWLRRSLGQTYRTIFSTLVTPKAQELIATPFRHSGNKEEAQRFFEDGLVKCFRNICGVQCGEYPVTVFYAFKQSETEDDEGDSGGSNETTTTSTGWETMLEGVTRAGFSITGTWPVRTERAGGFRNKGQNALASSIVLVCRRRPTDAPLATRKELITALRRELPEALRDLQRGNVAPVDLAQASIGPGMAVFTRYSKVMETNGSAMSVRTALGLINQALDEVLAEQEGEFDTDTRWALAWFEQFGMDEGAFGIAETLSKAKNTSVNGLVEAGVVKARAGKVQLLRRDELPDDWNPATDKRLTVWEVTQQLIRTVEKKGESAAAVLLHQLGGMGEIARDLAYRLYTICERKKWADEAMAYNGLVIAWSELSKLALSERSKPGATQTKMFE